MAAYGSEIAAEQIELVDQWIATNVPAIDRPRPSAGWSSWG